MITSHLGREQITVSSTVQTLNATPTLNSAAKTAVLYADYQVQTDAIRRTIDGSTAPVAGTTGMLRNAGSAFRIWGLHNIENFKMIRETTDATVVVNYWGRK